MNKNLKYLIFFLIGIIIYNIVNHSQRFSIGGPYTPMNFYWESGDITDTRGGVINGFTMHRANNQQQLYNLGMGKISYRRLLELQREAKEQGILITFGENDATTGMPPHVYIVAVEDLGHAGQVGGLTNAQLEWLIYNPYLSFVPQPAIAQIYTGGNCAVM